MRTIPVIFQEEPLRRLMDAISAGQEPADVPNLTWRDRQGELCVNLSTYIPNNLDRFSITIIL